MRRKLASFLGTAKITVQGVFTILSQSLVDISG